MPKENLDASNEWRILKAYNSSLSTLENNTEHYEANSSAKKLVIANQERVAASSL